MEHETGAWVGVPHFPKTLGQIEIDCTQCSLQINHTLLQTCLKNTMNPAHFDINGENIVHIER